MFDELVAMTDRAIFDALGGEPVTYTPQSGPPATVTGMYDANFVLAKGGAHAGVEAVGEAVFFRLSDLPADPETDTPTLTIRGNAYSVIERMPDGMGGIVLAVRRII
jgi:hypothetical protein